MDLLDTKRRRLRVLLLAAAMLGIGSASLGGALAVPDTLAPAGVAAAGL